MMQKTVVKILTMQAMMLPSPTPASPSLLPVLPLYPLILTFILTTQKPTLLQVNGITEGILSYTKIRFFKKLCVITSCQPTYKPSSSSRFSPGYVLLYFVNDFINIILLIKFYFILWLHANQLFVKGLHKGCVGILLLFEYHIAFFKQLSYHS